MRLISGTDNGWMHWPLRSLAALGLLGLLGCQTETLRVNEVKKEQPALADVATACSPGPWTVTGQLDEANGMAPNRVPIQAFLLRLDQPIVAMVRPEGCKSVAVVHLFPSSRAQRAALEARLGASLTVRITAMRSEYVTWRDGDGVATQFGIVE
jgi:hypothetical protein